MASGISWEEVPQARAAKSYGAPKPDVALSLNTTKHGTTQLWLTVSPDAQAALGWSKGSLIGLQIGRDAKNTGWLRLYPSEAGRPLRQLPNSAFLSIPLVPPAELAGRDEGKAECEHKALRADRVLLVQIPWSLDVAPTTALAA